MNARRVECLCPLRHILMVADVPEYVDDLHAMEEMRFQANAFIESHPRARCKCGAPPETWFCEVPPVSDQAPTRLDESFSAGAQTENELREWKRPEGMTVLN